MPSTWSPGQVSVVVEDGGGQRLLTRGPQSAGRSCPLPLGSFPELCPHHARREPVLPALLAWRHSAVAAVQLLDLGPSEPASSHA